MREMLNSFIASTATAVVVDDNNDASSCYCSNEFSQAFVVVDRDYTDTFGSFFFLFTMLSIFI